METTHADTPESVERKLKQATGLIDHMLNTLVNDPLRCPCGGVVVGLTILGVDQGLRCWTCRQPYETETH